MKKYVYALVMLILMSLFMLVLYFLIDFIFGLSKPIIDKIVLCINLSLLVTAGRWGDESTEFGRKNDLQLLIFSSIVVIIVTDVLYFGEMTLIRLILLNAAIIIISFALYWYYKISKRKKEEKTKSM
ncbi:MAG: hypothetical protein LBQ28_07515 [Prevotellaceae bacterium]|nr:hypothetical protein [Prevotellaceae bacterium]